GGSAVAERGRAVAHACAGWPALSRAGRRRWPAEGWRPRAAATGCGLLGRGGLAFLGLALARALLGRSAAGALGLFALGEVGLAHGGGVRGGSLAFQDRVGGGAGVQLDGADGVVIARDGVVDQVGVVVGVDDGDHRDAELLGFLDGDVLVAG